MDASGNHVKSVETQEEDVDNNKSGQMNEFAIIDDHYGYPTPMQDTAIDSSELLDDDRIEQLQNSIIAEQNGQIEGIVSNNVENSNNNGEPGFVDSSAIGNGNGHDAADITPFGPEIEIENENKPTPQIPPTVVEIDKSESQSKTKTKVKTKQTPKGKTVKTQKTPKDVSTKKGMTIKQPSKIYSLWAWIHNNCFHPFFQSFQQQIIADCIQTGLSILPILPIWHYRPFKWVHESPIACQFRPKEEILNEIEMSKNGPKKKKTFLKRLFSVEGLFFASTMALLVTVLFIDNDEPKPSKRNYRNHHSNNNYYMSNQQNFDFTNAAQAAYFASTMPRVEQSPQRGNFQ